MNERIKIKVKQMLDRGAKGLLRFCTAFLFSLFLFLIVFCRVAYMPGETSFDELFPVSLGYILISLGSTILFSVLWRLLLEWKHKVSLLYEAVNIPALAGFYFLWHMMPMNHYFAMYVAGLSFSLPCLCLFLLQRQMATGLFPHVFVSFVQAFGIAVLTMGLGGICLLGINALLVPIAWSWGYALCAFSFVLVGINVFLSCFPCEKECPRSASFLYLLKRVFLPAYAVLLAILYGYIGKILFLWEMPVGKMNWYASFAVAVFSLFYFCLYEETDNGSRRFLKYGALALFPVMVVQALGIYIRFEAYGLTAARYASMICSGFGLAVIAFAFFRRDAYPLFLLAGIIGVLCSMTPLNLIDVPVYDQGRRLERVLVKNQMINSGNLKPPVSITEEDAEVLRSAYNYLKYSEGAWWFPVVEQLKNDDRFTELLGSAYDQRRVIRSYEWNEIPVTGYRRLIHFRSDTTENHGELLITNGDEIICLDIRPYLQEIKEKGSGEQKETAENMTYRVNENRILHFVWINYYWGKDPHFMSEGYLLEK